MADGPFTPRRESFDLAAVVDETIAELGLPMDATWRLDGRQLTFTGACANPDGISKTWSVRTSLTDMRSREHARKDVEGALLQLLQFLDTAQSSGWTFRGASTPEQRYVALKSAEASES